MTTHIKKITAFAMAMVLSLSFATMQAFAKTPEGTTTAESTTIVETADTASARAMTYGNVWLNSGGSGSFKVHTDISGKMYFTLKIESNDQNCWANLKIKRPDGKYLIGKDISLNPGSPEKKYYILSGIPGDYTIEYNAGTSSGMRIMCWIY